MFKKNWIFVISIGISFLGQQNLEASVASFWKIENKKEADAVVELERFLRLLFFEDQQTVLLMKAALNTIDSMQTQERLNLLSAQDEQGNTFFDQVILSWPQVHLNNRASYIEFLKVLISYGINLNRQNKQGNSSLHLAYQVRSAEIAGVLELNDSVDQTLKNKRGEIARRQIVSSSARYQRNDIPSIGENIYWCLNALCILHDGECF